MHHNPQNQEQLSIEELTFDPPVPNSEDGISLDNEEDNDFILEISLLTTSKPPNWNDIISLLRKQSDVVNGISHEINHEKVRIERESFRQPASRCELYDFAQQLVNLYCGALEIVSVTEAEESLKDSLLSTLKEQAIENLNHTLSLRTTEKSNAEITKECRKFLVRCNSELIGLLKNTVLRDLKEQRINEEIRIAEAYSSFAREPAYKVLTFIQISPSTYIAQKDRPITKLSLTQQDAIRNCTKQPWYKELSPIEQKLLEKHKDVIVQGQHSIPTVLRLLPLARNAYIKTTSKVTILSESEALDEPLAEYSHSGTLTPMTDNADLSSLLTQQVHQQLKEAARAYAQDQSSDQAPVASDCQVFSLTLCSKLPGQKFCERHFPTLAKQLFDKNTVDGSLEGLPDGQTLVIPINGLRAFSKNNITEAVSTLCNMFVDKMSNQHTPLPVEVAEYLSEKVTVLNEGTRRRAALRAIKEWDKNYELNLELTLSKEYIELAKEIIDLKKQGYKLSGFGGRLSMLGEVISSSGAHKKNKSAVVASTIAKLWNKCCPDTMLNLSCKSGKDRTGYISTLVDTAVTLEQRTEAYQHDQYWEDQDYQYSREQINYGSDEELDIPLLEGEKTRKTWKETSKMVTCAGHTQFLSTVSGVKAGCYGLKPVAGHNYTGGISREAQHIVHSDASKTSSNISLNLKSANPDKNPSLKDRITDLMQNRRKGHKKVQAHSHSVMEATKDSTSVNSELMKLELESLGQNSQQSLIQSHTQVVTATPETTESPAATAAAAPIPTSQKGTKRRQTVAVDVMVHTTKDLSEMANLKSPTNTPPEERSRASSSANSDSQMGNTTQTTDVSSDEEQGPSTSLIDTTIVKTQNAERDQHK